MRWIVLIGVLLGGCSASSPQWSECDVAAQDCGSGMTCVTRIRGRDDPDTGRGYCSRACADLPDAMAGAYEQGCEGLGTEHISALCSSLPGPQRACVIFVCENDAQCPDGLRCTFIDVPGGTFGACEP